MLHVSKNFKHKASSGFRLIFAQKPLLTLVFIFAKKSVISVLTELTVRNIVSTWSQKLAVKRFVSIGVNRYVYMQAIHYPTTVEYE